MFYNGPQHKKTRNLVNIRTHEINVSAVTKEMHWRWVTVLGLGDNLCQVFRD